MLAATYASAGLAFIEGVGFDPFFRGLLSVLVGVVVLIGGTYLIVATNSGSRTGGLIAAGALFGWMFLMGVVWSIYAIGWVGEAESWALVEVNRDTTLESGDGLVFAESEEVQDLAIALESFDITEGIEPGVEDPDVRQAQAVQYAREQDALAGWNYLATSDAKRGEASSSAEEFLIEEQVFGSTAEFVPLTFGAFATGGKPALDPDIAADDPDKGALEETFTDAPARVWNTLLTFVQFWHPQELVAVQFQGVVDVPTLPGEAPPVATADPTKPVVTVVLERDRGGPIPSLIGGQRFVPVVFTIFNGILFLILCWMMHIRDQRERAVRTAAAAA